MNRSLRIRLTALYGGLFALFVGLIMLVSYALIRRHLERTLTSVAADSALTQLGTQYLLAFLGATILATALGWTLAGRELASTAREFDARERFAANASHELRSPLTVIRTEVEVACADPRADVEMLRAMGADVLETVDRMDCLLDDLITLIGAGKGLPRRDRLDLSEIAAAAVQRASAGLAIRLELERLDPVHVRGERRLLERLVENLVENGVRYNTPGGFVAVVTGADEGAFLRVHNSGPTVEPATAQRLLEPFERGGRRREDGGAGLGLSIVRAVAEAHAGSVELSPRPEGGLDVEVRFPRAR